jgi:hypothetical protein
MKSEITVRDLLREEGESVWCLSLRPINILYRPSFLHVKYSRTPWGRFESESTLGQDTKELNDDSRTSKEQPKPKKPAF